MVVPLAHRDECACANSAPGASGYFGSVLRLQTSARHRQR